jgi:hypothetical protein
MKSYVIKLEDKAAFTNICMSKGIEFKEDDFKTDKINDTFSFEIIDDEKEKQINDILKQHPDIDVLKRSKMNEMLLTNILKTLK